MYRERPVRSIRRPRQFIRLPSVPKLSVLLHYPAATFLQPESNIKFRGPLKIVPSPYLTGCSRGKIEKRATVGQVLRRSVPRLHGSVYALKAFDKRDGLLLV